MSSPAPVFVKFVSSVEGRLVSRWDATRSYFGARVATPEEIAKGSDRIVWDAAQVIPLTADFCRRFERELHYALLNGDLKARTRDDYEAYAKAKAEAREKRRTAKEAEKTKAAEQAAAAEKAAAEKTAEQKAAAETGAPALPATPGSEVERVGDDGASESGTQLDERAVDTNAPAEPAKKPSKGGK